MSIVELVVVTFLLTITGTYIFVDKCDQKQLDKFTTVENILFVLFIFGVNFITIFFFLAAVLAVAL